MALARFTLSLHLPVLLASIFLGGPFSGGRMSTGTRPSKVYRYVFIVVLALIAVALSIQDPACATLTRVLLTPVGALVATFLIAIALLDTLTDRREGLTGPGGRADGSACSWSFRGAVCRSR